MLPNANRCKILIGVTVSHKAVPQIFHLSGLTDLQTKGEIESARSAVTGTSEKNNPSVVTARR